jgi:hypothetical protein
MDQQAVNQQQHQQDKAIGDQQATNKRRLQAIHTDKQALIAARDRQRRT